MLDLYWRAAHGHPIPEAAWPAVMFARWRMQEPYSWARALGELAEGIAKGMPDI